MFNLFGHPLRCVKNEVKSNPELRYAFGKMEIFFFLACYFKLFIYLMFFLKVWEFSCFV